LVDFDKSKYAAEFAPEFLELETLDFINKNENFILIGTPGAGKTHHSIGLELPPVWPESRCCLPIIKLGNRT
jgi:hypothetical protein